MWGKTKVWWAARPTGMMGRKSRRWRRLENMAGEREEIWDMLRWLWQRWITEGPDPPGSEEDEGVDDEIQEAQETQKGR